MAIAIAPITRACLFWEGQALSEPHVRPDTRIGASTLLDRQLSALLQGGVTDVAVYGVAPDGVMSTAWEPWRAVGLSVSPIADHAALSDWAGQTGHILIIASKALFSDKTVTQMAISDAPKLFVRDAATSDDRHERIDLNDRWTGMAVLPARFIGALPALDADWSLQSALLRHAVQAGLPRETVRIGPDAPFVADIAKDPSDLDRWQERAVRAHFDEQSLSASPLRRWITLPLARAALPLLWDQREEAMQIVRWSRFALLAIAMMLALLQWPVAAVVLLLGVLMIEEIDRQNDRLAIVKPAATGLETAYWAIWFTFPAIALVSVGIGAQTVSLLAGLVLSLACAIAPPATIRDRWVVQREEALILILLAAIFGLPLLTAALLAAVAVLSSGFWRSLWLRLKAI